METSVRLWQVSLLGPTIEGPNSFSWAQRQLLLNGTGKLLPDIVAGRHFPERNWVDGITEEELRKMADTVECCLKKEETFGDKVLALFLAHSDLSAIELFEALK